MEIKIVATTGRARGQAVEVRAAKYFIGRHDNCQLRPDIDNLAGIHALLEQREDHLFLRDFGAEGGTGINDRVLHSREIEVFDDDLIQIGPLVLTLSVKSKGHDHRHALRDAPPGWPFLEGVESPAVVTIPVAEPSRRVAEPVALDPTPVVAFLARQLEPLVASAVAVEPRGVALAAASHSSEAAVAPRTTLARPIVARHRGHRAISCEMVDDVMVVTLLSPDLNEEETVSPVRYELRTILDEDEIPERTVIDLGQTRFLSSRAVGVLLAHYQGLERQGAAMRVCRVSPEIRPVIDQMRLSMLVDIYLTLEEAIETPWE